MADAPPPAALTAGDDEPLVVGGMASSFRKFADVHPDDLTPAMRQYVEQKRAVGDAVLLFRMGDFYETFFDDAVLCAKTLGIALTTRERTANPIPMAGIPHHALDSYLRRLVAAGLKVAISEQLEDPKSARGLIRRDVTRIVTAGTLIDEALLSERESNVLVAMHPRKANVGLAVVELAGGKFEALNVPAEALLDELVRLKPAELLIEGEPRGGPAPPIVRELQAILPVSVTYRQAVEFSTARAESALLEHFGVATLAGFGFEHMDESLCAAGAIIRYLRETQRGRVDHLCTLRRVPAADHVGIDQSSWRSLEISQSLRGGAREGSLLHAIDRTVTPAGGRCLRRWLTYPLRHMEPIIARQDAVGYFVDEDAVRRRVRDLLKRTADVERIASRAALARTIPRDLKALSDTLVLLPELRSLLGANLPAVVHDILRDIDGFEPLADMLRRALRDNPSSTLRDGGIIAEGYHAELDRLRAIGSDGQAWLADYQRRQIELTGIERLKVGFNQVFGYYIEISHASRGDVPAHYVRRQTVKNAERYTTEELKRFEEDVLSAAARANELEFQLFEELRQATTRQAPALLRLADALGRLDALTGLAQLAVERRYVRPLLVEGNVLDIRDGRHPVLDLVLDERFVPNDTRMNGKDARLFVITGPNMAGKSTYIRQVALLVLLAQTGSFVPASAMTFTPVDRIFARVGASDEITRGQSTFMVEMTEAANILRNATRSSLVVLDEIGRGTSTFDGLSLAWAITEHLASQVGCRTLVATHYHEMTELAELLSGVKNYNVAVREAPPPLSSPTSTSPPPAGKVRMCAEGSSPSDRPGMSDQAGIIFLHRIVEGGADKSYGVHVARLAGVPAPVIRRSLEILDELQRGFERPSTHPRRAAGRTRPSSQLSLFPDPAEALLTALKSLEPSKLSGDDALRLISEWRKRFAADDPSSTGSL